MNYNLRIKFILFFLSLNILSCQQKPSDQNHFVNVKAFYCDWASRKAIELKQNQMAHDFVLKAIENQDNAALQSNLGITFDLLEKKEDAEKSFLSALNQSTSDEEKFKYHFNLGVLKGAQKKIAEALNHYQSALDILPTSVETKHNIELLIQQQKKDQKDKNDDKDKKGDGKDKDDKKQGKDKDKDKEEPQKDQGQDRKSNSKYKPRPFKGDQLTEGDVKKILGELSQQDQKIRSNFNKKDQRKEDKNEKDW